MMNSFYVPSPFTDAKKLLSVMTVVLGMLLLFRIKASKKFFLEKTVEHPPISPVGTIEWMKARSKPNFSPQYLAWCRQMAFPEYRLKTLYELLVITMDIHLLSQVVKDKGTYKPTSPATYNNTKGICKRRDDITMAPEFSSSHLKRRTEVALQDENCDTTNHGIFFDCIEELENGGECSDNKDFFFDCNEELENTISLEKECSNFFDWELYRNYGRIFLSAF